MNLIQDLDKVAAGKMPFKTFIIKLKEQQFNVALPLENATLFTAAFSNELPNSKIKIESLVARFGGFIK